jgi:hypothetical protein
MSAAILALILSPVPALDAGRHPADPGRLKEDPAIAARAAAAQKRALQLEETLDELARERRRLEKVAGLIGVRLMNLPARELIKYWRIHGQVLSLGGSVPAWPQVSLDTETELVRKGFEAQRPESQQERLQRLRRRR